VGGGGGRPGELTGSSPSSNPGFVTVAQRKAEDNTHLYQSPLQQPEHERTSERNLQQAAPSHLQQVAAPLLQQWWEEWPLSELQQFSERVPGVSDSAPPLEGGAEGEGIGRLADSVQAEGPPTPPAPPPTPALAARARAREQRQKAPSVYDDAVSDVTDQHNHAI
jgi:hypothetical protein